MKSVKELRQSGYKVNIQHYRCLQNDNLAIPLYQIRGLVLNPCGGKTVVSVSHPTEKYTKAMGEAFCSIHDNYSRKTGVNLALERALKLLS